MASKFAAKSPVDLPDGFSSVLKAFITEVLREQPHDIVAFGAKYFEHMARSPGEEYRGGTQVDVPKSEEVEQIVVELFKQYDSDGNGHLDPGEFQSLMHDLQVRIGFPVSEIDRFLAEADRNQDDRIEYEEFIPLALQIIQSLYAKTRPGAPEELPRPQLIHGLSERQFDDTCARIFQRFDAHDTGVLTVDLFKNALQHHDLGLTRREVNAILFRAPRDEYGRVPYAEFLRDLFPLLQHLTAARISDTELENDEIYGLIMEKLQAADETESGVLSIEAVSTCIQEAGMGLSRLQAFTVVSEAETDDEGNILFAEFVPRAVAIIRSMLKFEAGLLDDGAAAEEEEFHHALDSALRPLLELGTECEFADLRDTLLEMQMPENETRALLVAASSGGGYVDLDQFRAQAWGIVTQVRLHT